MLVVEDAAVRCGGEVHAAQAGFPPRTPSPRPAPVLAMPDMTLNLAGGHYLRIKLALQAAKGTSEELDTSEAAPAIIEQFSDRPTAG